MMLEGTVKWQPHGPHSEGARKTKGEEGRKGPGDWIQPRGWEAGWGLWLDGPGGGLTLQLPSPLASDPQPEAEPLSAPASLSGL